LNFGDFDENQNQLRPHIVWFGEEVPALEEAVSITETADYCRHSTHVSVSKGGLIDFTKVTNTNCSTLIPNRLKSEFEKSSLIPEMHFKWNATIKTTP
jgi:NAD-dependent deacetylase